MFSSKKPIKVNFKICFIARYTVNLNTNLIKINFKCYFYFLSFIKFYKNAIISRDKKFYNTHNYGGENVYIKQFGCYSIKLQQTSQFYRHENLVLAAS